MACILVARQILTCTTDSAIFLEFLPASHAYLLTVLSIFWAFAQLFGTLVAWPLLGTMTCETEDTDCTRGENMGWRYFVITMGGVALIMFAIRFLAFTIFESPKYHMGKGRDDEAVRIVHEVARRNGKESNLTIDDLRVCEGLAVGNGNVGDAGLQQHGMGTSNKAAIKRKLEAVNAKHVKALFATKKLAFSTGAIMAVWAFIGLAFPLYVRSPRVSSDPITLPVHLISSVVYIALPPEILRDRSLTRAHSERLHPLCPPHTRRRSRRRLDIHNLPQFQHYRRTRRARCDARRCTR